MFLPFTLTAKQLGEAQSSHVVPSLQGPGRCLHAAVQIHAPVGVTGTHQQGPPKCTVLSKLPKMNSASSNNARGSLEDRARDLRRNQCPVSESRVHLCARPLDRRLLGSRRAAQHGPLLCPHPEDTLALNKMQQSETPGTSGWALPAPEPQSPGIRQDQPVPALSGGQWGRLNSHLSLALGSTLVTHNSLQAEP